MVSVVITPGLSQTGYETIQSVVVAKTVCKPTMWKVLNHVAEQDWPFSAVNTIDNTVSDSNVTNSQMILKR